MDVLSQEDLFKSLLELELKRSLRYQYFTSLLMIEADSDFADGPSREGQSFLKRLTKFLRKELRETDLIGVHSERVLAVLLLYSDKNGARNVASRLTSWASNFVASQPNGGRSHIRLGGACFPSHATNLEGLFEKTCEMLNRANFEPDGCVQILD
ncbi:MAG: diguanylate cyclase [Acidobacteriota bacterium]